MNRQEQILSVKREIQEMLDAIFERQITPESDVADQIRSLEERIEEIDFFDPDTAERLDFDLGTVRILLEEENYKNALG